MKEMIKKVREEKGGFTLAELLIVVAIVAVLVAIAIPVFNGSLASANQSTDEANARNAVGISSAAAMTKLLPSNSTVEIETGNVYYFQKNGTIAETKTEAYEFLAAKNENATVSGFSGEWAKGQIIEITFETDSTDDGSLKATVKAAAK